jgi:hypothetical protein
MTISLTTPSTRYDETQHNGIKDKDTQHINTQLALSTPTFCLRALNKTQHSIIQCNDTKHKNREKNA